MKYFYTYITSLAYISIFSIFVACTGNVVPENLVLPTEEQVAWANAEIGVIIHLDINIYAPETFQYNDKNTLPPLSVFNPSHLDTDQWIKAAKSAGANYAVLVAKHGTGFALWPTKANDYHIGNTNWKNGKGDIVADFIASCEKYDVKPGIYYNTNVNTLYGAAFKKFDQDEQKAYNNIVLKQLTELWTNYGPLFEIWFDGGVMTDQKGGIASSVSKLIDTHQPQAILFQGPSSSNNLIRWVGNEDGRVPYPHWSTSNFTTSSLGIEEILGLNGDPGQYGARAKLISPTAKNQHGTVVGYGVKAKKNIFFHQMNLLSDITQVLGITLTC